MKKLLFLLIVSGGALSAIAQEYSHPYMGLTHGYAPDSLLSRWVVDINLLGGALSENLTTANTLSNYKNSIASVSNTGNLKFTNGSSFGFDAQLGYFFGPKCNFGIGTGFMYLAQQGNATLDQFHVEYQANDFNNNTFRQVITADNAIKEKLQITNINIPILLKYKKRFSRRLGFTADLGALVNLQMRNAYSSNATFDYEAIYETTGSGAVNNTVYDNSPTPGTNDILYTKAQYMNLHDGNYGYVQNYFNSTLRNEGYNVGLGIKPNNNSGSVSYMQGSIGLLVQPSLNYYLSDMVALNLGVYYLYQPFKNSSNNGYMLTNTVGEYNSVLNTVTASNNQSYGVNLGVRIYVGKAKDSDHDGIPDKDDDCPHAYGLPQFNGCPDTDGDGIPDKYDMCPRVPGLAKFDGCPDSDGDGIPDQDDSCPYQAGPIALHGCPDRDGDGIPDKYDLCPDKPGPAKYHGCPDTDGDGIPDNLDLCPDVAGPIENHGCPYPAPEPHDSFLVKVSTPIHFEVNGVVIHKTSYPVLEEALRKLDEDPDAYIVIDGYTDITGSKGYNRALSLKRANAVKARLVRMGIKARRIKVIGHGAKSPAESNKTEEGRMENRRAVMHLSVGD